jgi:hypothetical protein
MNIAQIETNLQKLIKSIKKSSFIYDLLLAYGQPKASITRLQKGGLNLSKVEGEILWKKKLFFKSVKSKDLHALVDEIKKDSAVSRQEPRFIILTDFETLLAVDRKTANTLDIPIEQIAKYFDFFLPWAGMEKAQHQNENPADVKAAEKMAKLYDELKKDNPVKTGEQVHNLNVFLSRLLFCFFAEDTGIFEASQFTNAISSHTQVDGSDLHTYLDKLFEVMNTESKKRRRSVSGVDLPAYLEEFPYVNGGLFRNKHRAPKFTRRSRQAIIESGELDWSAINPDIFGSMIQAVVTAEHRGGMGMHYTSVPNIMKVIEPLFLTELYEEVEAAKGNTKKLMSLLHRIWKIKIFDPACGSGNFLIIAYRELRRLEIQIFKELRTKSVAYFGFSQIRLSNFYGIELDDFAHEVAILSLWLAEHQMNQLFLKEFGKVKPALPLTSTGNIVQGNACRLDWEVVCPKEKGDEIYILGNPPYLGSSMQSVAQKEDMALVFKGIDGYKNLDYIACWFLKGANFIQGQNAQYAFVSTNSICQGEQVALLWPHIFNRKLEIGFAHTSFKWVNNAKANAGVSVVIVGIRNRNSNKLKKIFYLKRKQLVKNINPYLAQGDNLIILKSPKSISNLQEMDYGSKTVDGGNLTLTRDEKNKLLKDNPNASKFIKSFIGSDEFLKGEERYCIWIEPNQFITANQIPEIKKRISAVDQMRLESPKIATQRLAKTPYAFGEIRYKASASIIIPLTTSERREYIPVGFLTAEYVVSNSASVICNAELYSFSIISSRIHNIWIRAVCGSLETRIRYSSVLGYNTFPFPNISDAQKKELEKHVYRILEEREKHSEKTLAQLYDPDKMPGALREAHHQNDLAIERIYRSKPFSSDEDWSICLSCMKGWLRKKNPRYPLCERGRCEVERLFKSPFIPGEGVGRDRAQGGSERGCCSKNIFS